MPGSLLAGTANNGDIMSGLISYWEPSIGWLHVLHMHVA